MIYLVSNEASSHDLVVPSNPAPLRLTEDATRGRSSRWLGLEIPLSCLKTEHKQYEYGARRNRQAQLQEPSW
jgi:hypothetical protein